MLWAAFGCFAGITSFVNPTAWHIQATDDVAETRRAEQPLLESDDGLALRIGEVARGLRMAACGIVSLVLQTVVNRPARWGLASIPHDGAEELCVRGGQWTAEVR